MKVLAINPPYTGLGGVEGHGGSSAPLNLGYIISYARKLHPEYEFSLIDAEALRYSFEEIKEKISNHMPDVVAIHMTTPSYGHSLKCAVVAKEVNPNIVVITGGAHPSAFPEEVINESSIDACVSGEGELPFLKFLEALDANDSSKLDSVPGLSHTINGKPHISTERSFIQDISTIPFPARDLMPNEIYGPSSTKRLSNGIGGNMITSRGCFYNCTYCESVVIWSRKVRARSAENIVSEMEELRYKYNVGEINFHDDILPMRREHILNMCQEIQKRKLKVIWYCLTRVNFVWPDVMEEMYKAGCRKIFFGLESGNNEILKIINKKATIEQARKAVKICRKAKLKVSASFMIGNIGESEETIRQTIDFAKSLDLHTASFFTAIPYPGTQFYRQALAKGYISKDMDWKNYAAVGTTLPPINLPGLSQERIRDLQAKALREFYLRPKILLRQLLKLTNFRVLKSLFVGAKLLITLSFKRSKEDKASTLDTLERLT